MSSSTCLFVEKVLDWLLFESSILLDSQSLLLYSHFPDWSLTEPYLSHLSQPNSLLSFLSLTKARWPHCSLSKLSSSDLLFAG